MIYHIARIHIAQVGFLQLGGTNLRVCEVKLLGKGEFHLRQQKFKISEALKTGEATTLFDYIAESVGNFMSSTEGSKTSGEHVYLGFTFSFPVEQTALNKGTLITWTKVGSQQTKILRV